MRTAGAPGSLNFRGCFAYKAERDCRLLYVGGGFLKIETRWRGRYGIRYTTS